MRLLPFIILALSFALPAQAKKMSAYDALGTTPASNDTFILTDTDDTNATKKVTYSPKQQSLHIAAAGNGARRVTISGADGRICVRKQIEGAGTQVLSTKALAPGLYIVRVTEGESRTVRTIAISD